MKPISIFKAKKTPLESMQVKEDNNVVHIGMSKDICVCCGAEIPEGFGMVCPACSKKYGT